MKFILILLLFALVFPSFQIDKKRSSISYMEVTHFMIGKEPHLKSK